MANHLDALRTLSDPTRLRIFERLGDGPISVAELAREVPVSRPAVSQHLKVLKDAGLVFDTASGTRRLYQLNPAGVEMLRRYFDQFWDRALRSFKDAAERKKEGR
jgi:DNA-binding transcriptional ArsR family regulator